MSEMGARILGLARARRELRRVVLADYERGVSVQELSQDYGIKPRTVRDWLAEALRERALRESGRWR